MRNAEKKKERQKNELLFLLPSIPHFRIPAFRISETQAWSLAAVFLTLSWRPKPGRKRQGVSELFPRPRPFRLFSPAGTPAIPGQQRFAKSGAGPRIRKTNTQGPSGSRPSRAKDTKPAIRLPDPKHPASGSVQTLGTPTPPAARKWLDKVGQEKPLQQQIESLHRKMA